MIDIVAVPSQFPGGLEARASEHFGHCGSFTLVSVFEGDVTGVAVIANPEHQDGGCMVPVDLLASQGVTKVVAAGMGQRPLVALQQAGIAAFRVVRPGTVADAVAAVASGAAERFAPAFACGGGHGHG